MEHRAANAPPLGQFPSLEDKVGFLCRADSYPEHTASVEPKETHMSWVFLTDDHAYKLKKPVRTEFLDFSTLQARQTNCQREVDLNRRLAPEIYLGLSKLSLDTAGKFHLDGKGETVDWLVRMRRLPLEANLEWLILNRKVARTEVERVAERLCAFYQTSQRVLLQPAVYLRRLAERIETNCRTLCRAEFKLPADRIDNVARTLLNFLDAHTSLIGARAGIIVEGHGDLRPEHVYLNKDPMVLDCLEFNRDFRLLDPIDELSYLAMECNRLGNTLLENELFDAYAIRLADYPGRGLVLFYKASNAVVRAAIAIRHLDESGRVDREKWTNRALQYLALAETYALELA